MSWVDSVPVRPARRKRITVSEFEWVRAAPAGGEAARLTARFWINSTELMAILVEETPVDHGGNAEQTTDPPPPRVRMGGRCYLLSVQAPAQTSTA